MKPTRRKKPVKTRPAEIGDSQPHPAGPRSDVKTGTRAAPKRKPNRVHNGRIITFYSYKGGTGRTMMLANFAWLLATAGKQVLVVDWDLEAPGIHRYFRPFLDDPDLASTSGLVEFFAEFSEGARQQSLLREAATTGKGDWHKSYANLLRYAVPLNFTFPADGAIDFVGAGRQGPAYGAMLNSIRWDDFYEKLGGGIFLEEVKSQLRTEYDYILIDSRTGLSDSAGICTVQMPDDLIVGFTLNRQSVEGASAVASSADQQRRKPLGEPGLRIWPVAMRVELAERDRLASARRIARMRFFPLLWHMTRTERADYWARAEILYFPFYAYEEILATIVDSPGESHTLLSAVETIGRRIVGSDIALPTYSERDRRELRLRFERRVEVDLELAAVAKGGIFFSYSSTDLKTEHVDKLKYFFASRLPNENLTFGRETIPFGTTLHQFYERAIATCDITIVFVTHRSLADMLVRDEWETAFRQRKTVLPLYVGNVDFRGLPPALRALQGLVLPEVILWNDSTYSQIYDAVRLTLMRDSPSTSIEIDPDDPQRGQWGGSAHRDGFTLSGKVRKLSSDWFEITLTVSGIGLKGQVEFNLHSSFRRDVVPVKAKNAIAKFVMRAWGAFTVGALVRDTGTKLELNLADLKDAPKNFRER